MTAVETASGAADLEEAALSRMHCPYCGGELGPGPRVEAGPTLGTLRCACGEHAVLEGIACLADDATLALGGGRWRRSMELMSRGDGAGAVAAALAGSVRTPAGRAMAVLSRAGVSIPEGLRRRAERDARRLVVEERGLSFAKAVRLLRNRSYGTYLVHRFVNPSMVVAGALIALLKKLEVERPRVLDLGGGAGHASWMISLARPDARVVLADADFTNLWLAKRLLARGAECVCVDAEAPLPFEDGSFDVIFSLDALHYVRGKAGLGRELERVAAPGAVWLLAHLHNRDGANPAPGLPLRVEDWGRLFPGRWFAEGELLRGVMEGGELDLGGAAGEELRRANALCAVAGPQWMWQRHEVGSVYDGAARGLNPLYVRAGDGYERRWPSAALWEECAAMERWLPERARGDEPWVRIPLPEGYL